MHLSNADGLVFAVLDRLEPAARQAAIWLSDRIDKGPDGRLEAQAFIGELRKLLMDPMTHLEHAGGRLEYLRAQF